MHTMVFKLALLCNLFLASVAQAVPSFRRGARLARRQNQSNYTGNNWAGVIVTGDSDGAFTSVTGTFTVPTPSGADGGFSISIGIDGDTCQDAVLQTGIEVSVTDGVPSYRAWYESSPSYGYIPGFNISAGDVIRAVIISNTTALTGLVILHNLSAGDITAENTESSQPLCEYNAEWLVEDYLEGSNPIPFANVGTVQFTEPVASGPRKQDYSPSDGNIVNIQQNLQLLTSVTIDSENNILIQYV